MAGSVCYRIDPYSLLVPSGCCWASSALRKRKFLRISWLSFIRRLAPNEAGSNIAISVK